MNNLNPEPLIVSSSSSNLSIEHRSTDYHLFRTLNTRKNNQLTTKVRKVYRDNFLNPKIDVDFSMSRQQIYYLVAETD